ncbi:MAG: hypothetical protein WC631_01345 [Candidatus Paceibacterota bacterium]|jgi:hypothetical protein
MGFFSDDTKPRVTKEEFQKVRGSLSANGFTLKEINRVEEIFRGDMYEEREKDKGVDEFELQNTIAWMRANMSKHNLSEPKIAILEREMIERINHL